MWATYPLSASSGYHAELHEGCYKKHTNPLNCRTSSSDISGYHADFHEGRGTVGEWQWRGTAWQGKGMGTARARHDICELALTVARFLVPSKKILRKYLYKRIEASFHILSHSSAFLLHESTQNIVQCTQFFPPAQHTQ
jgi:hypothetical protein